MKTDRCREWRESLGAYALGHLSEEERAGLDAHLEGCSECRAEVATLGGVATLLPHADPARFDTAPEPSRDLGRRILDSIGADRRAARRRRRFRFGLAFSGAATAAAVAVVLLLTLIPSGADSTGSPSQRVDFAAVPAGVQISANLVPHAFGTEIQMYVTGIRSGTLCRVFLRGPGGTQYSAGSFRYRWGDDSEAVLSSGLDLSRTEAIGVRAGKRTFIAPVAPVDRTAAFDTQDKEHAT